MLAYSCFLIGFRPSHLSDKLLFFESQSLPFELDLLYFLAIFSGQLVELDFAFPELICLSFVFLVDSHDLFDIALHAVKLCFQLSVLNLSARVILRQLFGLHLQILLSFGRFTQTQTDLLNFCILLKLKLLTQLFVELVFFLEEAKLLPHLPQLCLITAPTFFDRGKHLI